MEFWLSSRIQFILAIHYCTAYSQSSWQPLSAPNSCLSSWFYFLGSSSKAQLLLPAAASSALLDVLPPLGCNGVNFFLHMWWSDCCCVLRKSIWLKSARNPKEVQVWLLLLLLLFFRTRTLSWTRRAGTQLPTGCSTELITWEIVFKHAKYAHTVVTLYHIISRMLFMANILYPLVYHCTSSNKCVVNIMFLFEVESDWIKWIGKREVITDSSLASSSLWLAFCSDSL